MDTVIDQRRFDTKIKINPKILKFNLVTEKAKNKFFSLIFNEVKSEQKPVATKLPLIKTVFDKSMSTLRLHMGLNSTSYNNFKGNNKDEIFFEPSEFTENIDVDVFGKFKNMKRKFLYSNLFANLDSAKIIDDESDDSEEDGKPEKKFKRQNTIERFKEALAEKEQEMRKKVISDEYNNAHREKAVGTTRAHRKMLTQKNMPNLKNLKFNLIKKSVETNENKEINYKSDDEELRRKLTMRNFDFITDQEALGLGTNNPQTKIDKETLNSLREAKPKSKKINVTSIFYYDWIKMNQKNKIPYYLLTTPLTKFNEINVVVQENPLLISRNITVTDFCSAGGFKYNPVTMPYYRVYVHDQHTALFYRLVDVNKSNSGKRRKKDNFIRFLIKPDEKEKTDQKQESKFKKSLSLGKKNQNAKNILFVVLNDFFDSFTKYESQVTRTIEDYKDKFDKLKVLYFNLPGQAMTIFESKTVFNNIYYSEVLDRLLFYLIDNEYIDHSYQIVLIGFGNGAQIALTYASCFEKFWDFIHSMIFFNGFIENDSFLNKSMTEITTILENTKNPMLVDFFIKSITVNPSKLWEIEKKLQSNVIDDSYHTESIGLIGFNQIASGYFYNVKINYEDLCTPICFVHSNQNCFITINNINPFFANLQVNTFENNRDSLGFYTFDELKEFSQDKKKLIVLDASHDLFFEDDGEFTMVLASFMRYVVKSRTNDISQLQ